MDIFREDGHLTDTALDAVVRGEDLPQLSRLEISEHLAYCDLCLQRYTDALSGSELLIPANSCQESLWVRIRMRTFRLLTSRYATAAAAVILALTVLWSSKLPFSVPEPNTNISEAEETLPEKLDSSLQSFSGNLRNLFGHIGDAHRMMEGDLKS